MNQIIYLIAVIILVAGLFIMLTNSNYIKKIIGLGIFQSSVLILYIAFGKVENGIPPIIRDGAVSYSSPIPHVLMLTAIVVGFATMSVALALVHNIYKRCGSADEYSINEIDDH